MNLKAIIEGWKNYKKDTDIDEDRLKAIAKCPHNVTPKINKLKVKDRYPETSERICDLCICPLPAKARQDIDKCPCWKK